MSLTNLLRTYIMMIILNTFYDTNEYRLYFYECGKKINLFMYSVYYIGWLSKVELAVHEKLARRTILITYECLVTFCAGNFSSSIVLKYWVQLLSCTQLFWNIEYNSFVDIICSYPTWQRLNFVIQIIALKIEPIPV